MKAQLESATASLSTAREPLPTASGPAARGPAHAARRPASQYATARAQAKAGDDPKGFVQSFARGLAVIEVTPLTFGAATLYVATPAEDA